MVMHTYMYYFPLSLSHCPLQDFPEVETAWKHLSISSVCH